MWSIGWLINDLAAVRHVTLVNHSPTCEVFEYLQGFYLFFALWVLLLLLMLQLLLLVGVSARAEQCSPHLGRRQVG